MAWVEGHLEKALPGVSAQGRPAGDGAAPELSPASTGAKDDFDFSTVEAEQAMRAAIALVLEVREEVTGPLARKVALYERTLGLAVLPVLLRRAILTNWRRIRRRRRRPR